MDKITATVTKGAKEAKPGIWVFDVSLPDGETKSIWSNGRTDLKEFTSVHTGDTVELGVGREPGKYFFNKTVRKFNP